jgi:hypothetical protein
VRRNQLESNTRGMTDPTPDREGHGPARGARPCPPGARRRAHRHRRRWSPRRQSARRATRTARRSRRARRGRARWCGAPGRPARGARGCAAARRAATRRNPARGPRPGVRLRELATTTTTTTPRRAAGGGATGRGGGGGGGESSRGETAARPWLKTEQFASE